MKHGESPTIHHTTQETRERAIDRLRRTGVPADAAHKIADQATREAHEKLNKR